MITRVYARHLRWRLDLKQLSLRECEAERMSAREPSEEKATTAEALAENRVDVAVGGGSQAGLAMGYYLRELGRRFVILERAGSIAPAWRERWDSLKLFTPRRYSAAAGPSLPGRSGRVSDAR